MPCARLAELETAGGRIVRNNPIPPVMNGKLECGVLPRAAKTSLKGPPASDADELIRQSNTNKRTIISPKKDHPHPDINSEFNLGNATARVARRSPQQAPSGSERDGMSQFPQSLSGCGCK
jgi:hypothetical protein